MSGKVIYNTRVLRHYCKGKPGILKRILFNVGLGSKWECNDCGQVWVLEHYQGWGWDWTMTSPLINVNNSIDGNPYRDETE